MTTYWATPYTECRFSVTDDVPPGRGVVQLVANAPAIVHPPYAEVHVTSSTDMTIVRTAETTQMVTHAVDRAGAAVRVLASIEPNRTTVRLEPPVGPMPADWVADPLVFWALLHDDCITMHAAAVTVEDAVVILTGFHNAGKSTLATQIARSVPGAELLADDQVVISAGDELKLCAGYADELAGHRRPVTCQRILIVVMGEGEALDSAGQWLTLSQFVVGLGFESSTTELAGDGLARLLEHADVVFAPARTTSPIEQQISSWLQRCDEGEPS